MTIMQLSEIPKGARIAWAGKWVTLTETRRHAMTVDDGTVWVIIDGHAVEPPIKLDFPIVVDTSIS